MEPDEDRQLRELLHEWKVGDAPKSLDERVLGRRRCWRFLLMGSIRVPVPVAIVIIAVMSLFVLRVNRRTSVVTLKDFQPVQDPVARIIHADYGNE